MGDVGREPADPPEAMSARLEPADAPSEPTRVSRASSWQLTAEAPAQPGPKERPAAPRLGLLINARVLSHCVSARLAAQR